MINTIKDFVNKDKIYIGSSAGSCICSPTIEMYNILDDPNKADKLQNYKGLDIIDFNILPHYGREKYIAKHEKILEQYKNKCKILTLKDNQAIYVKEKNNYKVFDI